MLKFLTSMENRRFNDSFRNNKQGELMINCEHHVTAENQ